MDLSDVPSSSPGFSPRTLTVLIAVGTAAVIALFAAAIYIDSQTLDDDSFLAVVGAVEARQQQLSVKLREHAPYDIDASIAALDGLQAALKEAESFNDFIPYITADDPALVHPKVLKLKYDFFEHYLAFPSHSHERKKAEVQRFDRLRQLFLEAGSILDVGFNPLMGSLRFGINSEQARKLLAESDANPALTDAERKAYRRYLDFLVDAEQVSRDLLQEWDALNARRDRLYLAVLNGENDEAVMLGISIVEQYPDEIEAHMLLMMTLLERGLTESGDMALAERLLDDFQKRHPVHAAGFLLRGVLKMKQKDFNGAQLDFRQAEVYYPETAKRRDARFDLYAKRNFLKESKSGMGIVSAYKAMAEGNAYFSPDFQMAQALKECGNAAQARKKVLEHFVQRRSQGEWDRIVSDFRYSHRLLDSALFALGNDGYALEIAPSGGWFQNKIIVQVKNTGTQALHNVTLLLSLRFTDMAPEETLNLPADRTLNTLLPGETAEMIFSDLTALTQSRLGQKRTFSDLITYSGIVLSDAAVFALAEQTVKTTVKPTWREETGASLEAAGKVSASVLAAAKKALMDRLNAAPGADSVPAAR